MFELMLRSLENLVFRIRMIKPVFMYCTMKILIALDDSWAFRYLCPSKAESSKNKAKIEN